MHKHVCSLVTSVMVHTEVKWGLKAYNRVTQASTLPHKSEVHGMQGRKERAFREAHAQSHTCAHIQSHTSTYVHTYARTHNRTHRQHKKLQSYDPSPELCLFNNGPIRRVLAATTHLKGIRGGQKYSCLPLNFLQKRTCFASGSTRNMV